MPFVHLAFYAIASAAFLPSIDLAAAARCFRELELIADEDGGKLWGLRIYGPVMLVDRATLEIACNEPDPKGELVLKEGVWSGKLAPGSAVANTAIGWNDKRWAMVIWPLAESRTARAQLLVHESWHRIQPELGLEAEKGRNNHLDTLQGRYLMDLEWHALAAALRSEGVARDRAIADALTFRVRRRELFEDSAESEARLEIHEGLAEYTGVKLRGTPEPETRLYMAARLEKAIETSSYVRSFAYETGPAYGLLLDQYSERWRRALKATSDLGGMLRGLSGAKLPDDLAAAVESRRGLYRGRELWAREFRRDQDRLKRVAELKKLLVEGPTLTLPLVKWQMVMNPSQLTPIEGYGTVYGGRLEIRTEWGELISEKAGMISADFKTVTVTAPASVEGLPIRGDGWTLMLNKGWRLKNLGGGSFAVEKAS